MTTSRQAEESKGYVLWFPPPGDIRELCGLELSHMTTPQSRRRMGVQLCSQEDEVSLLHRKGRMLGRPNQDLPVFQSHPAPLTLCQGVPGHSSTY